MTTLTNTPSGFAFGAASVDALTSISEGKGRGETTVIGVTTAHDELHIYVSPTGRSVRVFRGSRELCT